MGRSVTVFDLVSAVAGNAARLRPVEALLPPSPGVNPRASGTRSWSRTGATASRRSASGLARSALEVLSHFVRLRRPCLTPTPTLPHKGGGSDGPCDLVPLPLAGRGQGRGAPARAGAVGRLRYLAVLLLFFLTLIPPAEAVQPDEILADPALEERARDISAGLRCLVCQNQSIDDSDAPLARDLRLLVRERLEAGDSNDEVVTFVVDRYGEYVLLNPRIGAHTVVLWAAPVLLLIIGSLAVYFGLRSRRKSDPAHLTEEEKKRIDALLDEPE